MLGAVYSVVCVMVSGSYVRCSATAHYVSWHQDLFSFNPRTMEIISVRKKIWRDTR